MIEALALADDLTGAIEVAAQFAPYGIPSQVTLELSLTPKGLKKQTRLLVIDTESRHVSAAEAHERVFHLAAATRRRNIRSIYKKTDSTLRGHIGSELAGLLEAWPDQSLIYAPAYPKLGRTCRQGQLYVNGKPVHETTFADDPLNRVRESYIPNLLAPHTTMPVIIVGVDQDLCEVAAQQPGPAIFVCDGQTDRDLQNIAEALNNSEGTILSAGPAGLPEHIARLTGVAEPQTLNLPAGRTFLTVCGSVHETSLAQVRRAEEAGVAVVSLAPEQLFSSDYWATSEGQASIRAMADRLRADKHLIVTTLRSADEVVQYVAYANKLGLDTQQAHARIIQQLGQVARVLLETVVPDTLIVFGGDTALGVLQACQCTVLETLGEILPGVPVSRLELAGVAVPLVTKAGGFGSDDVLCQIRTSFNKSS